MRAKFYYMANAHAVSISSEKTTRNNHVKKNHPQKMPSLKAEKFKRDLIRYLHSQRILFDILSSGDHPILVIMDCSRRGIFKIKLPCNHSTETLSPPLIKRILREIGIELQDFLNNI